MIGWRGWLGAGCILAGLSAGGARWVAAIYRMPSGLLRTTAVFVPKGSADDVAETLRFHGVVGDPLLLRGFAALTWWNGPMRSAEFSFPAHASIALVLTILRNGRPVQHLLTFPEGVNSAAFAGLVAGAYGLTGAVAVPDEGAILPETYAYAYGATRNTVVRRAGQALDRLLASVWQSRDSDLGLRSAREMLILASLVERETHLAAERPLVARVFLNRLRQGMRLQSDPTVVYGESGGFGALSGGITRDALARLTPYNTYAVWGLPVGPICAPGQASIEAVAHPARSEALYFVANGNGGHVFADTLVEHDRNVSRYRMLRH